MFVEHVIHELRPGGRAGFVAAMEAAAGVEAHVGEPLGLFGAEGGRGERLVSLWRQESFAARQEAAIARADDAAAQRLDARLAALVERIEHRFCLPMPFWHGRRDCDLAAAPGIRPFLEHRIYQLKPGALNAYLEAYGADGFAIHETHAPCAGFYASEVGAAFQLISLWRFESFEERLARRAALNGRADWRRKMKRLGPLVERIENCFLTPLPGAWRTAR